MAERDPSFKFPEQQYEWALHELEKGDYTSGGALEKIPPLVVAGVNAALEIQAGSSNEANQLYTNMRLAQIYGAAIEASSSRMGMDSEGAGSLIQAFMQGYVAHSLEVIKLQSGQNIDSLTP